MQLGVFFLEVVADGEGLQGNSRELDTHVLDEVEEVLGGEGSRGEAGGEESEMDRGEGDRLDGRSPEVAEPPLVDLASLPVGFHAFVVGPDSPILEPSLVGSGECHR